MRSAQLGLMASGLFLTVLAGTASATMLLSEDFETGFTDGTSVNGINGWTSGAPTGLGTSVTPNYPIHVPLLPGSLVVARPLGWGAWGRADKNLSGTPTETVIETSSYLTFNGHDGSLATTELYLKGTGSGTQYMSARYIQNGSKTFTVGYQNASGTWEMPGELPSFSAPLVNNLWYQTKMTLNTATKAMSWDYRVQDGSGGWTAWTNVATFTGTGTMFTPAKVSIGMYGIGNNDWLPLMDNLQVQNVPEPATLILLSLGGLLLRRRK